MVWRTNDEPYADRDKISISNRERRHTIECERSTPFHTAFKIEVSGKSPCDWRNFIVRPHILWPSIIRDPNQ